MGRPKLSSIAICKISIASLRQLPSHRSYLVSQVLFGEYVEIISKKSKEWYRVKCSWDGTIGWVDPKQFYVLKDSQLKYFEPCTTFALDHLHGINSSSKQYTIPISIGSNLFRCDGLNVKMPFGDFQYSGQIIDLKQSQSSERLLLSIAKRYIHCPFLYGGRSILGIDASGFIQIIFKMIGINIPRSCVEQSVLGEDIGFQAQSRVGDLAFFEDESHQIMHVGLILDDSKIMHVHGQVRTDLLDQQGIYDRSIKKYTFKLRTIRRVSVMQ